MLGGGGGEGLRGAPPRPSGTLSQVRILGLQARNCGTRHRGALRRSGSKNRTRLSRCILPYGGAQ
eukprot:2922965-Prymnesium_polylepis.1